MPFDFATSAANSFGAECHICELPAKHLVELSQDPSGDNEVELGSAVFLCTVCVAAVEAKDVAGLADRDALDIAARDEILVVATRIIEGRVRVADVAADGTSGQDR